MKLLIDIFLDKEEFFIKKEFVATFQVTRMVLFTVDYYTLGTNQAPYFSTSAIKFVRNKKSYSSAGQCQERVLPKGSVAYRFFKKWDKHHLRQLTNEQLDELYADLEELKKIYNYLVKEKDTFQNNNDNYFSFSEDKDLSMMPLKNKKKSSLTKGGIVYENI